MGWGIMRNPTIEQPTYDFCCDSDADIASLPVMPAVQDGSTCLVIGSSAVYCLRGDTNTWTEL